MQELPAHVARRISELHLTPHPEGGFYRETWRSSLQWSSEALGVDYDGPRDGGTCILFLLPAGHRSKPHRVRSDELWLVHEGDGVELRIGAAATDARDDQVIELRPGGLVQAVVPGGAWQSAAPLHGPAGYVLVGCVVVPGFDFRDFEMGRGSPQDR
ncbi:MAG: cupin domain-containing protein [Phycisphaerales bacterium]|nr:cupin domain-containing protein [Phycisphaerales bacterium]